MKGGMNKGLEEFKWAEMTFDWGQERSHID